MAIYNTGLDELAGIATADLRWLLLKGTGYVFNPDHATLAALTLASNEVTASGCARVALTGGTRTVNTTADRVEYRATNPNFGAIATGQSLTAAVLYRHVTTDADSIPVGYYDFAAIDSATISPYVVYFSDGLIGYTDSAA